MSARRKPAAPPDDYLYRSRLTYRQNRNELWFDVAEGLFSTANVDPGTAFLMRWLGGAGFGDVTSVLDLGCGYGPIGIGLARFRDDRAVLGVDRDALAVEYTAWNAGLNGVGDRVEARGSVGYADLGEAERFDLVASNIPAKVGPAALEQFLFGSEHHLTSDGRVAVVVIDRLREPVTEALERAGTEVLERHDNRGYAVFVFRPPAVAVAAASTAGDPYGRGPARRFSFRQAEWEVQPTFTLPEFDTLAYATQEAMRIVEGIAATDYVMAGVGHGHLAAYLLATRPSVRLSLVDRDLLALRTAAGTIERTFGRERLDAVSVRHAARPAGGDRVEGDCMVVRVDEREPIPVTAEAVLSLVGEAPERSTMILYGRAADTSRTVDVLRRRGVRLTVDSESRARGHAAVQLTLKAKRKPKRRKAPAPAPADG